jgi:hypothetical protein
MKKILHVDFVIKFLHGIRDWALSDSEKCYFLARFGGGKIDFLFSIKQLTGRWLFASSMRIGWMGFPTICNGKSGC